MKLKTGDADAVFWMEDARAGARTSFCISVWSVRKTPKSAVSYRWQVERWVSARPGESAAHSDAACVRKSAVRRVATFTEGMRLGRRLVEKWL